MGSTIQWWPKTEGMATVNRDHEGYPSGMGLKAQVYS